MPSVSQHGTLVADVVTTVTIAGNHRGFRVQRSGSSTADLWWSWGRSTAPAPTTAGANDSYRLPTGAQPDYVDEYIGDGFVVKLISTAALGYSVESW